MDKKPGGSPGKPPLPLSPPAQPSPKSTAARLVLNGLISNQVVSLWGVAGHRFSEGSLWVLSGLLAVWRAGFLGAGEKCQSSSPGKDAQKAASFEWD